MNKETIRKNNITGEWEHLVTYKNRTYWAQGLTGNVDSVSDYHESLVEKTNENNQFLVYTNVSYQTPIKNELIKPPFVSEKVEFVEINLEYLEKINTPTPELIISPVDQVATFAAPIEFESNDIDITAIVEEIANNIILDETQLIEEPIVDDVVDIAESSRFWFTKLDENPRFLNSNNDEFFGG